MAGILIEEKVLWAITMLLTTGLAALVLYRKNYKAFPVFFAYILTVLMQGLIFVLTYRLWGFDSRPSVQVAWGTQALVILVRSLAVAEICRRVLVLYRGIWALAWRLLVAAAAVILLYSLVVAGFQWQLVVLNADRGLELTIATVIAVLFLFAHHYEVEMEPAVRTLAIGFFLYSCFVVLNDTFLEHWRHAYETLWKLLGVLAFLPSILMWGWALRKEQSEKTTEPVLLPDDVYQLLAPEINFRLKLLNEQLNQLWHAEAKRP